MTPRNQKKAGMPMGAQDTTGSLGLVKKTISVSTDGGLSCEQCGELIADDSGQIHPKINHYLDHGYTLLHVGQQTTHDDHERPWHATVAVLGKA